MKLLPLSLLCAAFLLGCGGRSAHVTSTPWTGGLARGHTSTGNALDLAIDGAGLFVVSHGGAQEYSRNGRFRLTDDGRLVQASTGASVLGWTANAEGAIDGSEPISPLSIPVGRASARQATRRIEFAGNLDAEADPSVTYTTQVRVYDIAGEAHDLSILFSHHATNLTDDTYAPAGALQSWNWQAFEGYSSTDVPIGCSKIYFGASGQSLNRVVVPTSGVPAFSIQMIFDAITDLKTDSHVTPTTQDGFPAGTLNGYEIETDGKIIGLFTNGMTPCLGQIALATFGRPESLVTRGDGLGRASKASGAAQIVAPSIDGAGSLVIGAIENGDGS